MFAVQVERQKPNQRPARKLAPELEAATAGTVRVIVQTQGTPSAAQDEAIARADGKKQKAFAKLDAFAAEVPAGSLTDLTARQDVAYVSPDRRVRAQMDVTRETLGAGLVQRGFAGNTGLTGKGVGIAVIDSGISASHTDFQGNGHSRVAASVDFTSSGSQATSNGIIVSDGVNDVS
jgi:serine protease AprX